MGDGGWGNRRLKGKGGFCILDEEKEREGEEDKCIRDDWIRRGGYGGLVFEESEER